MLRGGKGSVKSRSERACKVAQRGCAKPLAWANVQKVSSTTSASFLRKSRKPKMHPNAYLIQREFRYFRKHLEQVIVF